MQGMQSNMVLPARRDSGSRPQPALLRASPMPVPRDPAMERLLIAGVLKGWCLPRVQQLGITAASFTQWHHRLVWTRLTSCKEPGPYSLYMALRAKREDREWHDLPKWIAETWDLDPTGCSAEYAATEVRRLEVRRELIYRMDELINSTRKGGLNPKEYERLLEKVM
jgi:hypothetical protein